MGAGRVVGSVLVVASIALLVAAVLQLYGAAPPLPAVGGDFETTGYVVGGLGVVVLAGGVVLFILRPRSKTAKVGTPVEPMQQVVIKRTEMNWGPQTSVSRTPSDDLQSQLDAVNQKIGRLKVQYGIGELSGETYKALIIEYEKERAAVELRIIEAGR